MRGLSEEIERGLFVTEILSLSDSPSPCVRVADGARVVTFTTLARIDAEFLQGVMCFDPRFIYSFISVDWPVHPAQDSEHCNEDKPEASEYDGLVGDSFLFFFFQFAATMVAK